MQDQSPCLIYVDGIRIDPSSSEGARPLEMSVSSIVMRSAPSNHDVRVPLCFTMLFIGDEVSQHRPSC